MVTESCIDHLRSLVKRGRQYEKPHWDIFEIITSAGGSIFLFGAGILITTTLDKEIKLGIILIVAMWVAVFLGAILGIIGISANFFTNKKHTSCLEEIDEILQKQEKMYNVEPSQDSL